MRKTVLKTNYREINEDDGNDESDLSEEERTREDSDNEEMQAGPQENQVRDIYNLKNNSLQRSHSPLFPRDIRAIIVGKSGAGKTTLLAHLLLEPEMLDYQKLMICGKSLNQPQYRIIQSGFDHNRSKNQKRDQFKLESKAGWIHEKHRRGEDVERYVKQLEKDFEKIDDDHDGVGDIVAEFHDNVADIPDPNEWDSNDKNLIVFDDIMLGPQSTPEKYYTRGRHTGVDCFYIAQSYFPLPRRTIRENANLFFFFQQDNKNLNHIYQDLCAIDGVSYELFRNFCNDVWREGKHNFITIDTTKSVAAGKYRKILKPESWKPNLER